MQFISYIFFRIGVAIISLFPFKLLYGLSNILAWILQKVLKYRLNVVEKNLAFALAELTPGEKAKLIKGSYRNLSDIMLESMKGFSMSMEAMQKRYVVEKPDFIDEYYGNDQNIILFSSHVGNWEWATYMVQLSFPHQIIGLAKPLKNKYINDYTNRKRSSTGTQIIEINKNENRSIIEQQEKPFAMVCIADQNPSHSTQSIPCEFFGVETYCLHGTEKMAVQNNWPVVNININRMSRGNYRLVSELIADEPAKLQRGEVTQRCFTALEKHIRKKPSDWLWTHKRWKRKGIY